MVLCCSENVNKKLTCHRTNFLKFPNHDWFYLWHMNFTDTKAKCLEKAGSCCCFYSTTTLSTLPLEVTINASYDVSTQQLCLLHHFISKVHSRLGIRLQQLASHFMTSCQSRAELEVLYFHPIIPELRCHWATSPAPRSFQREQSGNLSFRKLLILWPTAVYNNPESKQRGSALSQI